MYTWGVYVYVYVSTQIETELRKEFKGCYMRSTPSIGMYFTIYKGFEIYQCGFGFIKIDTLFGLTIH